MTQDKPFLIFADRDAQATRPLHFALRQRGNRVLTVGSAADLLDRLSRCSPDVVVLADDLVKDLESLVRLLRYRSSDSAVILVLSEPTLAKEELCRTFRLFSTLRPIDPEMFGELLDGILHHRKKPPQGSGRKSALVLCVDDDLLFLRSLSRVLARQGYRVASYDDPMEALQALPEVEPDVAILDVLMPGMNGLDLAAEIQDNFGNRIPIVLLTALTSDADIVKGYRRGARHYITKPCEPRTILEVVDSVVRTGSAETAGLGSNPT